MLMGICREQLAYSGSLTSRASATYLSVEAVTDLGAY